MIKNRKKGEIDKNKYFFYVSKRKTIETYWYFLKILLLAVTRHDTIF